MWNEMDEARAKNLEAEIERLRKDLTEERLQREKMEKEWLTDKELRQMNEAKRLRTALIGAGGIILALGGFVWAEIIWPVINAGRP